MDELFENITPELALVDPVLAAAARSRLPAPPDCLARPGSQPARSVRAEQDLQTTRPAAESPQRHAPRKLGTGERVALTLTWLLAAAILGSSLLAFIPPRGSSRPQLVEDTAAPPPAPPVAARGNATAVFRNDGRLYFRWKSDARAAFYNVVLLRNGKRIDLWPRKPAARYDVPRSIRRSNDPTRRLYRWFVYPGYRSHGKVTFGKLIGKGLVEAKGRSSR